MYLAQGTTKYQQAVLPREMGFIFNTGDNFFSPLIGSALTVKNF